MIVMGHRRSGNHLLMEYLKRAFGEEPIKDHHFNHRNSGDNKIYIVRDGKDVIVSCYVWWKNSGEAKVCNVHRDFKGVNFSDYLRGIEVPNYREAPPENVKPHEVQQGLFSDPVGFWHNHVLNGVFQYKFVRFEDIVNTPMRVIEEISKTFGLEIKNTPKRIRKLVGHHPRKGVIGDWVNYFTEEDMEYFHSKTSDQLMEVIHES